MKKLTFIRHGFPDKPFMNYDELDIHVLAELLVGGFSPGIDKGKTHKRLSSISDFANIDVVFTAESRRTIETAQLIKEMFGRPYFVTHYVNEVSFYPSFLKELETGMTFSDFRSLVLEELYRGKHCEGVSNVKKRLSTFIRLCKHLPVSNILVISHGFFMRFISLYKRGIKNPTLEEIKREKSVDFLERIDLEI